MNGESSDLTIWSIAFNLHILATFLVMLRLSRRGSLKSTIRVNSSLYSQASDIFMVIAYVLAIANSMVAWPEVRQGSDDIALSDSDIERLLVSKNLSDLLYTLANGATKLSIISFFISRLHPAPREVVNTWIKAACWTIAFTCLLALQCQPIQKAWKTDVEGVCINAIFMAYMRIFQMSKSMTLDLFTVFIATTFMSSPQTDSLEASIISCSGLIVGALDAYILFKLPRWLVQGTSYEAFIWPVIDLFTRVVYANMLFLYTVYQEYVTMKDSAQWERQVSLMSS